MALIWIAGVPGSGKSAVKEALQQRGFVANDFDDLGAARDNETGQVVTMPPAAERTSAWFDAHSWIVPRERLVELKMEARERPVFVCGTSSNERELWDLFDIIVVLDIDEAALRQRLSTRMDNDYGKTPQELARILDSRHQYLAYYGVGSVKRIDANRSLDAVVRDVLKAV